MATYTEGNKTATVNRIDNLCKAEVRLFFYFLIKKRSNLPEKKAQEFQTYLEQGKLPDEIGMITKKGGQSFCIRETHPEYYTVYVGENADISFVRRIKKILAKVKK